MLVTALPVLFSLAREMWETPFPISETTGLLEDARVMGDTADSPHSLSDPDLRRFFDPAARSWYRPFYWTTWYVFWHATHSLDASLLLWRLLEIGCALLIVLLFIWHIRPRSFTGYAAAVLAGAILIGMPGYRENLEFPLPMTLVGMPLAIAVWMLLERRHTVWHLPLIVLFTVLAVGWKEQGLVLVPVVIVAWWVGAPGARLSTAATITMLAVAYLYMRFTATGTWGAFEQDVGFGMEMLSPSEARERWAESRHWLYAYSVLATIANVLFSEPTDGVFRVVASLRDGDVPPWQINHVVTSTATTAVLGWWAIRSWRRDAPGAYSPETRLAAALCVAVAATGALGFNYTRDRLGGMAVVFYALAAYYAFQQLGVQLALAGRTRLIAGSLLLMLVSAGWQTRMIGTVDSVHARARRTQREWLADRVIIRTTHADRPGFLRLFNAMEPQGVAPIRIRPSDYTRRADRWLGPR